MPLFLSISTFPQNKHTNFQFDRKTVWDETTSYQNASTESYSIYMTVFNSNIPTFLYTFFYLAYLCICS